MDARIIKLKEKVLSFDIDEFDPMSDDYFKVIESVESIDNEIELLEDELSYDDESMEALDEVKIILKEVKNEFEIFTAEGDIEDALNDDGNDDMLYYNMMYPDGNDEDDDCF